MSSNRNRILTLRALISGCPAISSNHNHNNIDNEFSEVYRARWVLIKERRWLLQIIHCSRALDSALSIFISFHQCGSGHGLGAYLKLLTNHNSATLLRHLSQRARSRYQGSIVNNRNRYMHQAGAFPANSGEIRKLLSEMQDCLVEVLALQ